LKLSIAGTQRGNFREKRVIGLEIFVTKNSSSARTKTTEEKDWNLQRMGRKEYGMMLNVKRGGT
jgi:hypothetical protein